MADITIDLNDLFPMRASVDMVRQKLQDWDTSPYQDKTVQIKGCSPTWAHLMVAGKLFNKAAAIEFLMDDAKGGIVIPIYKR